MQFSGVWLRHPLLRHPLTLLFVVGLLVAGGLRLSRSFSRQCIDVSAETRAQLERDFARRSGHFPTEAEKKQLLRDYLDGEVLFREAEARHLGDGDMIVRRRLIQKMEFVAEGLAGDAAPQADALNTYYAAHAERYREPVRYSLRQIYLSRDRHGDHTIELAASLRERLSRDEGATLGDPFPRGAAFSALSAAELGGIFGDEFATAVTKLPVGKWSPPLPSSYGHHLVLLTQQLPASLPPLADVVSRVRGDFERDRKSEQRRAVLDRLRARYDIVIAGTSDEKSTQKGLP